MAKKWIKVAAVATTMAMAASSLAALTACGGKKGGDYTYRLATTQLPTSWNAHTAHLAILKIWGQAKPLP